MNERTDIRTDGFAVAYTALAKLVLPRCKNAGTPSVWWVSCPNFACGVGGDSLATILQEKQYNDEQIFQDV